ncbi:hypothetical protein NGRA_3536, partial [Nosema granulosis]
VYKITTKNIKNDIFRIELEETWKELKDSGKVKFVLRNSDDEIIEWHKEQFAGKREESFNYEDWKVKLFTFFAKKVEPGDFLTERQRKGEDPGDFLRRIMKDGRELSLEDSMILGVFRNGLTRNRDYIKLSLVGQTRITENLFRIIYDANKIAEESFQRLKKRREKSGLADDKKICLLNQISNLKLMLYHRMIF